MGKAKRKSAPMSVIIEEDRLNCIIDKLEFDNELLNRKNCLLENTRKKYFSTDDKQRAIVNKARQDAARDAALRAREAREKLVEDKQVNFALLTASGKACMPFKSLDQLNRFKMSGECEVCPVIDFCRTCRKAIRNIGRPASVKSTKKATENFKYDVSFCGSDADIKITNSPLGTATFSTSKSTCSGFRKILTNKYKLVNVTGNQISGLTKILNKAGFDLR